MIDLFKENETELSKEEFSRRVLEHPLTLLRKEVMDNEPGFYPFSILGNFTRHTYSNNTKSFDAVIELSAPLLLFKIEGINFFINSKTTNFVVGKNRIVGFQGLTKYTPKNLSLIEDGKFVEKSQIISTTTGNFNYTVHKNFIPEIYNILAKNNPTKKRFNTIKQYVEEYEKYCYYPISEISTNKKINQDKIINLFLSYYKQRKTLPDPLITKLFTKEEKKIEKEDFLKDSSVFEWYARNTTRITTTPYLLTLNDAHIPDIIHVDYIEENERQNP